MYWKASWVGSLFSIMTSLTGIDAIVFYGVLLFDEDFRGQGIAILYFFNFAAAAVGFGLLYVAGRKTLVLIMQIVMIISLVGMWYFESVERNQTLLIIVVCIFICAFEFAHGNIVWIYISEICNDKATSIAIVVQYLLMLGSAFFGPYMINKWLPDGKTWIFFAVISFLFLFYIIFGMKETKGKSDEEVKKLYYPKDKT